MAFTKKFVFLAINFIFMTWIMFSTTDFALGSMGAKFKYVFILFCLLDIVTRKKMPCRWNVLAVFALLTLHTLLWRYVFVNYTVLSWTMEHTKTMLLYLVVFFCAAMEVIHYECVEEYAVSSGIGLLLVLFVQVFTHTDQLILNPALAVHSFFQHDIMRASFGFMNTNFAGNSCFLTLCMMFMVYLYHSRNKLFNSRVKILIMISTIFVLYIMLSLSSRTPMICAAAFVCGSMIIRTNEKYNFTDDSSRILKRISTGFLLGFLGFALVTDLWGQIWDSSNRSLNVTENVHWIPILGTIWTGMGYVDNSAFITNEANNWISAFGVYTSSLDMNYLYLYCTTGRLGVAMYVCVLVIIGISLFLNRKQKYGLNYLVIYGVILFYAIWETVLFTPRFWAMMVPYVILLYGANNRQTKTEDDKGIKSVQESAAKRKADSRR